MKVLANLPNDSIHEKLNYWTQNFLSLQLHCSWNTVTG